MATRVIEDLEGALGTKADPSMTGKSKGALQYDDLAAWLIEEIPELEDAYKREMEWWAQW